MSSLKVKSSEKSNCQKDEAVIDQPCTVQELQCTVKGLPCAVQELRCIVQEPPCTVQELEAIITAPAGGLVMLPSTAYDEIIPGLFLGEGDVAQKLVTLRDLGVTHVLNAALGKTQFHVNTNHVMYRRRNIAFLGIEATDFMNFDLSPYFSQAADFIEKGLQEGKVYVHCVQGVSRSATIAIAYFMLKQYMRVQDATRLVRRQREISPNPGFLQQLCQLDATLVKRGHFHKLN